MFAAAANIPGLIEYVNTPSLIGTLVSGGLVSLYELQTVYGIMDAYDLLEIMTVDEVNQRKADAHVRNCNR